MKNYYELLGVEPTADADEVKRAFRREIARYHPDKVQHLGPEFQEIAATRAAELTEAYRILMDAGARRTYDATLGAPSPASPAADHRPAQPASAPSAPPPYAVPPPPRVPGSETLRQTQETVSQFVKKATLGRLRGAVDSVFETVEPLPADHFDAAFTLRAKRGFFQKAEPPVKLLICIVRRVDADSVDDTWPHAAKICGPDAVVCLLLLGLQVAPARELAAAIAEQRRTTRQAGPVVIPVDTREWNPLIPPETPPGVRKLLERLKLDS